MSYKTGYKIGYNANDGKIKINTSPVRIEMILIVWYCMFSYFDIFSITQYSAIILMLITALIPLLFFLRRCVIPKTSICLMWLCFTVVYLIQTILVNDFSSGLAWALQRFLTFVVIVFFIRKMSDLLNGIKAFLVASMVHVFATVMEFLVPDFIHRITNLLLTSDVRNSTIQLFEYDYHCGISQQASYDCCYIAVAFSILFASVMIKKIKYNYWNAIFLLISVVALILTGKRGLLLAAFVAAFVVFIVSLNASNKSKIRYLLIALIAIGFIYYIFTNTDIASNIIRRMQNDDLLSGRGDLWALAFEGITNHPIIGNGTGAYATVSAVSSHNSFLQIWYENGVIGLILVIFIFANGIIVCLKKLNRTSDTFFKEILLMSLCYQIFFIVGCMSDSLFHHYILLYSYLFFSLLPYSFTKKEFMLRVRHGSNREG